MEVVVTVLVESTNSFSEPWRYRTRKGLLATQGIVIDVGVDLKSCLLRQRMTGIYSSKFFFAFRAVTISECWLLTSTGLHLGQSRLMGPRDSKINIGLPMSNFSITAGKPTDVELGRGL